MRRTWKCKAFRLSNHARVFVSGPTAWQRRALSRKWNTIRRRHMKPNRINGRLTARKEDERG